MVGNNLRLQQSSNCRKKQPQPKKNQKDKKSSFQIQLPFFLVETITLASILDNPLIPLRIVIDKTTTSVGKYTLEMHPNRNDNYVDIAQDRPIKRKQGLKIHLRNENAQTYCYYGHDICHLL